MATRKAIAKKSAKTLSDDALAKRLLKLENRVSNDELRVEKIARERPAFEDDWEDIPKRSKAKAKTGVLKSFSGHNFDKPSTVVAVSNSSGTPNEEMLKLYKRIYPRLPVCVQNYLRLLSHPMQRPTFPWCSLLGDASKVVQYTEYGKAAGVTDAFGRAAIAVCPYALWNDTPCIAISDPALGNLVDPMKLYDAAEFQYYTCSSNPYPRAAGDYTSAESPVHVRPVAAAICISSIDTALNTKGVVTQGCNPSGELAAVWSMTALRQNSNNPAGVFQLGNCYPFLWTPPTDELAQFLVDEQLAAIQSRMKPNIGMTVNAAPGTTGSGSTCIVFLEGTNPGTSIYFEWAIHYELSPGLRNNQIPGTLKTSEPNAKAGQLINSAFSAGQQQKITSTPDKGLFDRFLDGLESVGSTVADIAGKFLGATAGEFVKTAAMT